MSAQQHTPGPWEISECFNVPVNDRDIPEKAPSVWLDRKADGATGLKLGFCSAARRERIFSDAHLIAAAPDLLAALSRVLGGYDVDESDPVVIDARTAISKAKGQA